MTNTDTPSPLAAAVEALLKVAPRLAQQAQHPASSAFGVALLEVFAKLSELEAALASDAAWRARAEAADAWAQAQIAYAAAASAYGCCDSEPPSDIADAFVKAGSALHAARRRYEETCRAG